MQPGKAPLREFAATLSAPDSSSERNDGSNCHRL
jgi:hypothetical protein